MRYLIIYLYILRLSSPRVQVRVRQGKSCQCQPWCLPSASNTNFVMFLLFLFVFGLESLWYRDRPPYVFTTDVALFVKIMLCFSSFEHLSHFNCQCHVALYGLVTRGSHDILYSPPLAGDLCHVGIG